MTEQTCKDFKYQSPKRYISCKLGNPINVAVCLRCANHVSVVTGEKKE